MDQVNIASGDDVVAVQVGHVGSHDVPPAAEHRPAPPVVPPVDGDADEVTVLNVRSGAARVGVQADVIHGPIVIGRRF